MTEDRSDRARGVLLGLACGDALGRPVEFESPSDIQREHGQLTEMVGEGTWNQPAGTITDDTEMALCIARSLAELGRFDPADIAERFVRWYESDPFDIGNLTHWSIRLLQEGRSWDEAGQLVWEQSEEGGNAGNGSVMRCAPLAVAYADYPTVLISTSVDSSRITHADERCTHGCAVLNLTLASILDGEADAVDAAFDLLDGTALTRTVDGGVFPDRVFRPGEHEPLAKLRDHLAGLPDGVDPASLQTTGYVVTTLQTALHDALAADSFEEAVVTAVNRGGDADTIGAVAGAVAGARFGAESIPERWLTVLDHRAELESLSGTLYDHPVRRTPADT